MAQVLGTMVVSAVCLGSDLKLLTSARMYIRLQAEGGFWLARLRRSNRAIGLSSRAQSDSCTGMHSRTLDDWIADRVLAKWLRRIAPAAHRPLGAFVFL